jgi:hypothetical protein
MGKTQRRCHGSIEVENKVCSAIARKFDMSTTEAPDILWETERAG